VPHRYSNVVAIAVAVDMAFMAMGEFVDVAVMTWYCKVGVNDNSC